MVDIHKLVSEHKELVINTRRDLHRIPEVGYTEEKTSTYVADYLSREGLEVQTGIAQFGVVGLLNTGKPGPTLMF
ncbi:MAG: amidohydrolase, partial [Deltaproteobacteria bacterium]|nr:amidohydrolase [Deltaproteobacteria bacterium]